MALAVDDRVPSWLNAIMLRLTDPSPAARFSGANAVIDAINAGTGLEFALQTDETRQSYVLSSAFVGRGTEINRLRSFVRRRVVEEAVDFGGICVVGDAGAGKSRILRELKHRVQFAGFAFVECDCYETDEAELGPLGEALRQLVYFWTAPVRPTCCRRTAPNSCVWTRRSIQVAGGPRHRRDVRRPPSESGF